jgi:hypothetical protein
MSAAAPHFPLLYADWQLAEAALMGAEREISARTVQTHLARACLKLAIAGRRDLPGALSHVPAAAGVRSQAAGRWGARPWPGGCLAGGAVTVGPGASRRATTEVQHGCRDRPS